MYARIDGDTIVQFPYTVSELRKDNPNVSFPRVVSEDVLIKFNVVFVVLEPRPDINPTVEKAVRRTIPEKVDTQWKLLWDVVPYTQEELDEIAAKQNARDLSKVESQSLPLFFRLVKILVEDNLLAPQDPRMAEIKAEYLKWKGLTGL